MELGEQAAIQKASSDTDKNTIENIDSSQQIEAIETALKADSGDNLLESDNKSVGARQDSESPVQIELPNKLDDEVVSVNDSDDPDEDPFANFIVIDAVDEDLEEGEIIDLDEHEKKFELDISVSSKSSVEILQTDCPVSSDKAVEQTNVLPDLGGPDNLIASHSQQDAECSQLSAKSDGSQPPLKTSRQSSSEKTDRHSPSTGETSSLRRTDRSRSPRRTSRSQSPRRTNRSRTPQDSDRQQSSEKASQENDLPFLEKTDGEFIIKLTPEQLKRILENERASALEEAKNAMTQQCSGVNVKHESNQVNSQSSGRNRPSRRERRNAKRARTSSPQRNTNSAPSRFQNNKPQQRILEKERVPARKEAQKAMTEQGGTLNAKRGIKQANSQASRRKTPEPPQNNRARRARRRAANYQMKKNAARARSRSISPPFRQLNNQPQIPSLLENLIEQMPQINFNQQMPLANFGQQISQLSSWADLGQSLSGFMGGQNSLNLQPRQEQHMSVWQVPPLVFQQQSGSGFERELDNSYNARSPSRELSSPEFDRKLDDLDRRYTAFEPKNQEVDLNFMRRGRNESFNLGSNLQPNVQNRGSNVSKRKPKGEQSGGKERPFHVAIVDCSKVIMEPLTMEQAKLVEKELEKALDECLKTEKDVPTFSRMGYQDKNLQVMGKGEYPRIWLRQTVKFLPQLWPNARLCVRAMPMDLVKKAKLHVPGNEPQEIMLERLKKQNGWAQIQTWRLYHATANAVNGRHFIFGIKQETLKQLNKHKNQLNYKFTTLDIKIMDLNAPERPRKRAGRSKAATIKQHTKTAPVKLDPSACSGDLGSIAGIKYF